MYALLFSFALLRYTHFHSFALVSTQKRPPASRKPVPDDRGSDVRIRIPAVLPITHHRQDLKAQLSQEHDAVRHVTFQ